MIVDLLPRQSDLPGNRGRRTRLAELAQDLQTDRVEQCGGGFRIAEDMEGGESRGRHGKDIAPPKS